MQNALSTVEATAPAKSLLDPVRVRILERLREPDSAAAAARDLGLSRQRVGYHVRELVRQGLLDEVGERRRGNTVEKLIQATARYYLIDPGVMGPLGADPEAVADRFSSTYLVAVAARTIREVSQLRHRADAAGQKLATLSLQAEVRFATPQAQSGFAKELAECLARLSALYHDENAAGGRSFRFVAQGYPTPGRHPTAPPDSPSPEP